MRQTAETVGCPESATGEDLASQEDRTDALVLGYPYVEQPEPGHFDVPGTYVDTTVEFGHKQVRDWSHGLGEIFNAVLEAGLVGGAAWAHAQGRR
jgi:hypothetical protein